MAYTERFSEQFNVLTGEHADSQTAGTLATSYVSLANYHRAIVLIDVGELQASATFDVTLYQATTTAGASAKAITGKSLTLLTDADDNVWACIEVRTEELDVDGGFDCIAASAVVANAAVEYSIWVLGDCSRFKPVPTSNWEEIVD